MCQCDEGEALGETSCFKVSSALTATLKGFFYINGCLSLIVVIMGCFGVFLPFAMKIIDYS